MDRDTIYEGDIIDKEQSDYQTQKDRGLEPVDRDKFDDQDWFEDLHPIDEEIIDADPTDIQAARDRGFESVDRDIIDEGQSDEQPRQDLAEDVEQENTVGEDDDEYSESESDDSESEDDDEYSESEE